MPDHDELALTPAGPSPRAGDGPAVRGAGGPARFHLRDIIRRREAGDFDSLDAALAALKGRDEGHFSINNHRGDWCEVEVRGGVRYVRYTLMDGGAPAVYRAMARDG